MLKTSKIFTAKYTFFSILNTVIISELVTTYLKDTEIFTNKWMYSAYGLLIASIFSIIFIEDKIKEFSYNGRLKKPIIDFLKLFLIFIIKKFIENFLETGTINIELFWLYRTFLILLSYFISDVIFADFLVKFNNYQLLFYFICKVLLSNYLVFLFLYNKFTINDFIDRFSFLISFIFFEIIIKKIIII